MVKAEAYISYSSLILKYVFVKRFIFLQDLNLMFGNLLMDTETVQ